VVRYRAPLTSTILRHPAHSSAELAGCFVSCGVGAGDAWILGSCGLTSDLLRPTELVVSFCGIGCVEKRGGVFARGEALSSNRVLPEQSSSRIPTVNIAASRTAVVMVKPSPGTDRVIARHNGPRVGLDIFVAKVLLATNKRRRIAAAPLRPILHPIPTGQERIAGYRIATNQSAGRPAIMYWARRGTFCALAG
jgi:hypothetical protein